VLVGYTGYQALKARTALQAVASDFQTFSGQLTSGDQAGARKTLADAQENARTARDNTSGPGWWVTGRLPSLGPNVRAVQTLSKVSDNLASRVLPDVVTASGTLQPQKLRPRNGRIDLAPLRKAAPVVERASRRLAVQAQEAQDIDIGPLAPEIARPVEQLQDKITRADQLADRASRAVRLLPPMLGADGTRRYLFAFQNNAEIRATGGIPGSFALLTAHDGRLKFGKQGGVTRALAKFAEPVKPLTKQELALFGSAMGRIPQSTNFTPDFPRTGDLLETMWQRKYGQKLDGVVSVDPVALSYVLRGTGSVKTAGDRTLTAGNAIPLLLSKVYAEIPDPPQQNVFFEAAARDVFDALSGGKGNPRAVLENVVRAASERRILVWSSHADEQRLIAPTAVGGGLETRPSSSPRVGVYFNSVRPSKLEYYLDYQTSVESTSCSNDRQHLRVTVVMQSRVPKKYDFLTTYVAPPSPLFSRGTIAATSYFFAPVGGRITSLEVDGKKQPFNPKQLKDRSVLDRSFGVKPGGSMRLTVDMVAGKGQTGTPELRTTPGVRSTGLGNVEVSACS
jgi:hypothetical protein